MSNGKGKERAGVGTEEVGPSSFDPPHRQSNSTINRVISSAKGLASSTFGAPSGNELSDRTSAALASAGKGHTSVARGGSAWEESSKASGSTTESSTWAPPPSGFRSHSEQHIAGAEAEFSAFLDDVPPFIPTEGITNDGFLNSFSNEQHGTGPTGENRSWPSHTSVQEQEAQDGKEVLDLLSDPTALHQEEADRIYNGSVEEEPVIWKMTELQRTEWHQRLQKDFPEPEAHRAMDTEHPLNLVPAQSMLTEDQREQWLEQWDSVLNRYADEVWGDLLPLVKEARNEVETIKEDHSAPEHGSPKALRRLGMILGHLRQ